MSTINNTRLSVLRYLTAFFIPDASLHSRQKWILGLINLSAVVVLWVSSSFLVNAIVEDDSYRKPFFITWINTSCFSFYIIPYLKFKKLSLRQFINKFTNEYKYHQIPSKDGDGLIRSYGSDEDLNTVVATQVEGQPGSLTCVESIGEEVHDNNPLDINIYDTFKLSIQFIILWYSANLVTNASLSYTSVASQTILSSTSSFFTLIIGYLVSVESINQNKIMGILLSFSGVLIVTKADTSDNSPNRDPENGPSTMLILWGNLLALSGALIYGIYTILLKFKTSIPNSRKERNLNTHLFFGFVGLICFLGLWPILVILHFTKVEVWSLPSSKDVWTCLVLNAVITFISDFCWCNAVLLTSPLTVTVGLSMAIPLAMVGDWVLKEFQLNLLYVFGATIVTAGFLIINKDEEEEFVIDE